MLGKVLLLVFLIIFEIIIICCLIHLFQSEKDRKKGLLLYAVKKEEKVVPGQPTRYSITVEIKINEKKIRKKIITADKGILQYSTNEHIPVIYIHSTEKVYWADEKKFYRLTEAGILAAMCVILFLLSVFMLFAIWLG